MTGNKMQYMLLIIEPVGQRRARTEQEGRALYDEMLRFSAALKERGLLQRAEQCNQAACAARQPRGEPT